MSAANPNPMEKSMVSVLVVANAGGGSPLLCGVLLVLSRCCAAGRTARRGLGLRRVNGGRRFEGYRGAHAVVPVLLPVVRSGHLRIGVGDCRAGFVASELLSVVR
jgi:hypothetical protein